MSNHQKDTLFVFMFLWIGSSLVVALDGMGVWHRGSFSLTSVVITVVAMVAMGTNLIAAAYIVTEVLPAIWSLVAREIMARQEKVRR